MSEMTSSVAKVIKTTYFPSVVIFSVDAFCLFFIGNCNILWQGQFHFCILDIFQYIICIVAKKNETFSPFSNMSPFLAWKQRERAERSLWNCADL